MANTTLGLEFDGKFIRGVELHSPSKGAWALGGGVLLDYHIDDGPAKIGELLKEKLKAANIKSSQVTLCLQGDTEFCREVRYPEVPQDDEPPIVQFQSLKDPVVSPEEAVIDYQRLPFPGPSGERRALVFTTKNSRLNFALKVCEAAGLKVKGVIPRAVAVLAAARSATAQMPGKCVVLVGGGELTFAKDQNLLLCRHIGTEFSDTAEQLGEIRRSLAAFRTQFPGEEIHGIYYATDSVSEDQDAITHGLKTPIQFYAPLRDLSGSEAWTQTADYLISAGAGLASGQFSQLPVNYADPKRVKPKPNRKRAWAIIGVGTAIALLALLWFFNWFFVSDKEKEIAELKKDIETKKKSNEALKEIETKMNAIKDWQKSRLVVLDELYDLFAEFPEEEGIRLTWTKIEPISSTTAASTPAINPAFSKTAVGKTTQPNAVPMMKPIAKVEFLVEVKDDSQKDRLEGLINTLAKHWRRVKWDPDLKNKDKKTYHAVYNVMPTTQKDYNLVINDLKMTTATGDGTTNTRRPVRRPTGGRP